MDPSTLTFMPSSVDEHLWSRVREIATTRKAFCRFWFFFFFAFPIFRQNRQSASKKCTKTRGKIYSRQLQSKSNSWPMYEFSVSDLPDICRWRVKQTVAYWWKANRLTLLRAYRQHAARTSTLWTHFRRFVIQILLFPVLATFSVNA